MFYKIQVVDWTKVEFLRYAQLYGRASYQQSAVLTSTVRYFLGGSNCGSGIWGQNLCWGSYFLLSLKLFYSLFKINTNSLKVKFVLSFCKH